MSPKPHIAIAIGSTRPTRFADAPAQWILQQAQARDDMDVELIDLRDHKLPFFDEMASNMWVPSRNPEAIRWQATVGRFDGYIFVLAEYNHSITGVLKNALDQAYKEWNRKPFTAISYGARAARGQSNTCGRSASSCRWSQPIQPYTSAGATSWPCIRCSATSRSRTSKQTCCLPPGPRLTNLSGGPKRRWPPRRPRPDPDTCQGDTP